MCVCVCLFCVCLFVHGAVCWYMLLSHYQPFTSPSPFFSYFFSSPFLSSFSSFPYLYIFSFFFFLFFSFFFLGERCALIETEARNKANMLAGVLRDIENQISDLEIIIKEKEKYVFCIHNITSILFIIWYSFLYLFLLLHLHTYSTHYHE